MATSKKNDGKTFADVLKNAPTLGEAGPRTVRLTGAVYRSEEKDKFTLVTGEQAVTLDVDAVEHFRMLQETETQRIVEIEVLAERLRPEAFTPKPILDPGGTLKEVIKDPIQDPQTIKELIKDPISDPGGTRKEVIKDPIMDPTRKELIKDPIQDPITWVEQIDPKGGFDQVGGLGGGVINPAAQQGAGGMAPFVMATPHHAPQAAVAMQQLAAQGRQQVAKAAVAEGTHAFTPKPPHLDPVNTIKEITKDPLFDPPRTIKELIKDPIQDPITWVEQIDPKGGFDQVGGLGGRVTNPPVWNLPGLMM